MAWTFYSATGEELIKDGGLSNIVDDTSPQLGGNLDMQARLLVGNGGSTGIAISAAGEVTMAAQPAFHAYSSSTQSNVTGDGTQATFVYGTEIFDQNADYDGTSTFTAPVTGRYYLAFAIRVEAGASATSFQSNIVTSNTNFNITIDPRGSDLNGSVRLGWSGLFNMDASDTVVIKVTVNGVGSDTSDFTDGEDSTWFSGFLVA